MAVSSKMYTINLVDSTRLNFDEKLDGQFALFKWRIANPKDFDSGNNASNKILVGKRFTLAKIRRDRMRSYYK